MFKQGMVQGFGIVLALSIATAARGGGVRYVDDDAPAGGDGASWSSAYRFLQDALADAAAFGGAIDEIRIAQGTYKPDQSEASPFGTGDRTTSFELVNAVALRGGYAGIGAPDPDARDFEAYETVLSGDLNGDDGDDFKQTDDNSYHVIYAYGVDSATTLDGIVVRSGNANLEKEAWDRGGGAFFDECAMTIVDCVFERNHAIYGGGLYARLGSLYAERVHCFDNAAEMRGGGMRIWTGSNLTVLDCNFSGNDTPDTGGGLATVLTESVFVSGCAFSDNTGAQAAGMRIRQSDSVTVLNCDYDDNLAQVSAGASISESGLISLADCSFVGNFSSAGAGGILCGECDTVIIDGCEFVGNAAGIAGIGGLGIGADQSTVHNSFFAQNEAEYLGGGAAIDGDCEIVNCVFSRNQATQGGGLYFNFDQLNVVNSSFSDNIGHGFECIDDSVVEMHNAILWGNSPAQIETNGGVFSISYSDIQGGWSGPGSNNIDADPLFVQPGTDDLHLGFGSPCVNMGDNCAIPAGIDTDLDGNPRIQRGVVDMGAYEGEYAPQPEAASVADLDSGQFAFLIPGGTELDPFSHTLEIIINTSGPDDSTYLMELPESNPHPDAGGYVNLGANIQTTSSFLDGEFRAHVYIQFDVAALGGIDPFDLDMTYYNETTNTWALAVSGNTVDSANHATPIGDRFTTFSTGDWTANDDLGDYGVVVNPESQQGFVWAVVDHVSDFGFGVAICPTDMAQPPNGETAFEDLLALLFAWINAEGDGPFDLTGDHAVDLDDLIALLAGWGVCSR